MPFDKSQLLGLPPNVFLAEGWTPRVQTWICIKTNGKCRPPTYLSKYPRAASPYLTGQRNHTSTKHVQVNHCAPASSTFNAPARSRHVMRQRFLDS